ncbi:MAG: sigma-E factor negative regulatory protein [Methylococcales bacterium]
MNNNINLTISQFLDDELDHAELDKLLVAIKNKPELKAQINRYQLLTQVLKDERGVRADIDFVGNINQQLKQEPHFLLAKKVVKKRTVPLWQKASFAVAASVASVAIIMSQQSTLQQESQPQQIAAVETQLISTVPEQEKNIQLSQHERFKAYLQAHNDDLYTHGSLTNPLVRTASYGQD